MALRSALLMYVRSMCGDDVDMHSAMLRDSYGDYSFMGLLDRLDEEYPETYKAGTKELAVMYFNMAVARAWWVRHTYLAEQELA